MPDVWILGWATSGVTKKVNTLVHVLFLTLQPAYPPYDCKNKLCATKTTDKRRGCSCRDAGRKCSKHCKCGKGGKPCRSKVGFWFDWLLTELFSNICTEIKYNGINYKIIKMNYQILQLVEQSKRVMLKDCFVKPWNLSRCFHRRYFS